VAALQQVGGLAERPGDVRDGVADLSEVSSWVLLPIAWMTRVIVPAALSTSAIVSGMRSAPGPRRTITNCPGWRISAIRGASTTRRVTLGDSCALLTIGCISLRINGFGGNVV
jgi:hypothetical protein